jgi:hypothetical protein
LFYISFAQLHKPIWQRVVWDKMQNLKDNKTSRFQHAMKVKSELAIGMTGT